MNAVQRKLQDRSGATLTVALLFFIMCAAAGSVILAAATTSTGRLAELQAVVIQVLEHFVAVVPLGGNAHLVGAHGRELVQ